MIGQARLVEKKMTYETHIRLCLENFIETRQPDRSATDDARKKGYLSTKHWQTRNGGTYSEQ
jgi:hypothetical protein